MNDRIRLLREESFSALPSISAERALIVTDVYQRNASSLPPAVLRALCFKELCERKSIYIGKHELIVGERGSGPKVVSTFPELNCHSAEDLRILRSRPMTQYQVDDDTIAAYESKVIPYWRGISIRDRAFSNMPEPWLKLYASGVFTEFMEQRAAGHTALDGLLYREGLLSIRQRVNASRAKLDPTDGRYQEKHDELTAMAIACDAALRFAERHAALAERMAESEPDDKRAQELRTIAQVCRQVPAHAPRNFHEAVQAYWFTHLGTITELNGWDAMSPGHLDQHLSPFYERDVAEGRISQDEAKELLSCLWIKVNNTPAPPKVGVTAQESGTYNDFTNINLGGLLANGQDGSSELSVMILEVLGELKLLQPQANLQLSSKTPKRVLDSACKVIRQGMGYPSIFNADEVVLAQVGMGKSLADAREGGTSGCVETGCFGKEAYMLHGYLNGPKLLELAMNNGIDPANGQHIGPQTGSIASMDSFEKLYAAWEQQLAWAVAWKTRVDGVLDELYGTLTPAPFLSLYIADCIDKGIDYYRGGARYNTDYIQCTGIGTMADSLSVLKTHAFSGTHSLSEFAQAIADNWKGHEVLRALALNKTPLFGNDDSSADSLASRVFDSFVRAIEYDGPNLRVSNRGARYRANFLSTTCHVYFGKKTGATPDGRFAGSPLSDGTSPSHGADHNGPTAVMNSLAKLDQARTGGTLLNLRFSPEALSGDSGIAKLGSLVRGYFAQGGHHVQFNVVDEETLLAAKKRPEDYRNLLVRVAGYSDYFVDLDEDHQNEILARSSHGAL